MYEIFSTREIADMIWLIVFLMFVLIGKKTRISFFSLIKAVFAKKIIIMFLLIGLYFGTFTMMFAYQRIWKWIYLKDIIIWFLLTAVPICFSRITKEFHSNDIKKIIIENITLTAIVEFVVAYFTFPLWIEIIMIPVILFVVLLKVVADKKAENQKVSTLLSRVEILIGIGILSGTVLVAVDTFLTVDLTDFVVSFATPLVYSVLLIPMMYLCIVYAKYDTLFSRIHFMDTDKVRKKHRWRILKACKLSYKRIQKASEVLPKEMYQNMSEHSFMIAIQKIKE